MGCGIDCSWNLRHFADQALLSSLTHDRCSRPVLVSLQRSSVSLPPDVWQDRCIVVPCWVSGIPYCLCHVHVLRLQSVVLLLTIENSCCPQCSGGGKSIQRYTVCPRLQVQTSGFGTVWCLVTGSCCRRRGWRISSLVPGWLFFMLQQHEQHWTVPAKVACG